MAHSNPRTFPALVMTLALLGTGCSHWIDITPSTDSAANRPATSITADERVPLILSPVKLYQNGSPQNPSLELERRFLGSLHDTNLFSHLALSEQDSTSAGDKSVIARLTVENTIDSHPGEAAWKGVVIGASMFLLSPVLDLNYDYGARFTLELERWDGTVKTYRADSTGTVRYNLFGATPEMIAELKGHVLEAGTTALLGQIVADTTFYQASSAPLTERTIHTVTIKSRRPTLDVIPISTSPAGDPR
ncbi:MAG: hypothetical protein U0412_12805 [Nitrospira sp.]